MPRRRRDNRPAVAAGVAIGLYGLWMLSQRRPGTPVPFFETAKQDGVDEGLAKLGQLPCGVPRTREHAGNFADELVAQLEAYRAAYGTTAGARGTPVPAWPKGCALEVGSTWRGAWETASSSNPERFSLAEPLGGDTVHRVTRSLAQLAAATGVVAGNLGEKTDELTAAAATAFYLRNGSLPFGYELSRLGIAVTELDDVLRRIAAGNEHDVHLGLQGELATALRTLAIALDVRGFSVPVFDQLDAELDAELARRAKDLPEAGGQAVVGALGLSFKALGAAIGKFLTGLLSSPGTLIAVALVVGAVYVLRKGGTK